MESITIGERVKKIDPFLKILINNLVDDVCNTVEDQLAYEYKYFQNVKSEYEKDMLQMSISSHIGEKKYICRRLFSVSTLLCRAHNYEEVVDCIANDFVYQFKKFL